MRQNIRNRIKGKGVAPGLKTNASSALLLALAVFLTACTGREQKPTPPPAQNQSAESGDMGQNGTTETPHGPPLGYNGPLELYLSKVNGKGLIVLEDTMTVAQEGPWRAWGLVRNETAQDVGSVTVTATLYDKTGKILEQPSSLVPLNPLRPGEPGPFEIDATVTASDVARVEWTVRSGEPDKKATRNLELPVYWVRDNVMAAGLRNKNGPLADAKVVAAFLDRDKKVVWVGTESMAPDFKRPLPPEGAANFNHLEVADEKVAAQLPKLFHIVWAVGRKSD